MMIKYLEVTGTNLPTAKITFADHCTIISGSSDTGKTFVFTCLEILFGSDRELKDIPEAQGYERMKIELTSNGKKMLFERALRGGSISVSIDDAAPEVFGRKELNDFLLGEIGIGKKRLRKNKNNDTVALSFSFMRPYFFINEISVVDDQSPILSGDFASGTREKSLFRLLLTGLDDSELIKGDDPKLFKARMDGSLNATSAILGKLNSQLIPSVAKVEDELDRCNRRVDFLTKQLTKSHEESSALIREKQEVFGKIDEINNQGIDISETLKRFNLLNDAYSKDLNRLSFIDEGKHLLSQLPPGKCPYCNQEMDHIHDGENILNPFDENLKAAFETERRKISFFKSDLENTISSLNTERDELRRKRQDLGKKIEEIDFQLKERASLNTDGIRDELTTAIEERDSYVEQRLIATQINQVQKVAQGVESETKKVAEDIQDLGGFAALFDLESEIEKVLGEVFKKTPKVTFDKTKYDIIIDGRPRSSFGKGMRSIYRASFHLGLMNLCIDKNIPHPGLLVIDSPVTAHEEAKDKVDSGIQKMFWQYLSKIKNGQVIVFENKQPSKDIQAEVKYYRFNGVLNDPNCGFFPPRK